MTLYNNGGASKTKLNESHKRWENEISKKNEEKLSRTMELNNIKAQALKELGYTEITEENGGDIIAKIIVDKKNINIINKEIKGFPI